MNIRVRLSDTPYHVKVPMTWDVQWGLVIGQVTTVQAEVCWKFVTHDAAAENPTVVSWEDVPEVPSRERVIAKMAELQSDQARLEREGNRSQATLAQLTAISSAVTSLEHYLAYLEHPDAG